MDRREKAVSFNEIYHRQNTKILQMYFTIKTKQNKTKQKRTGNVTFDEKVLILSRIFVKKLFIPYAMLVSKPNEKANDDYVTNAGIVSRECERF